MRFLLIIVSFFFFLGNAQKKDCSLKSKEYEEFFVVKNFNEAYNPWKAVLTDCPKWTVKLYEDGLQILEYRLENATDEDKLKRVEEALSLYDHFFKNFPQSIPEYQVKKALLLQKYNPSEAQQIFQLFQTAFNTPDLKVTEPTAYSSYFKMYFENYQRKEKGYTLEMVIDLYSQLTSKLHQLSNQDSITKEKYQPAIRNIKSQAKDLITCENLIFYFESKFSQNKDDKNWLTESLHTATPRCGNQPIILKMAQELYKIEPNSEAAEFLANAHFKGRNFEEAKKYFEEAANNQSNNSDKAKIYFTMATTVFASNYEKCKEYLQKSLTLQPNDAKIYIFLSQLYANNAEACTNDQTERKAIYYLAIKTAQKAAEIDPNTKVSVSSFVERYQSKTFQNTDFKTASLLGKVIKIGCWINESVTLSPL